MTARLNNNNNNFRKDTNVPVQPHRNLMINSDISPKADSSQFAKMKIDIKYKFD